jgi:hypothetical protein
MHLNIMTFGLPFASVVVSALAVGGCVVKEYDGPAHDPHADRIQHVSGGNYEIHPSANQGLCFDVQGDKAAAHQEVWLYNCHGKENQRWAFVDKPNNSSNITGVGGMCLDVRGWQTADGAPVQIYACGADQANQTFRHFEDGRIREVQSNKCLTATSVAEKTQITLNTCQPGNQGQVFSLSQ